ncbi:MAG: c-type cytochrome [Heliomarina sp.]|uniref:c-type cytochrome n=1 Tax=Heliomarina sp. TaxID=2917556 RepID=UPI004058E5C9
MRLSLALCLAPLGAHSQEVQALSGHGGPVMAIEALPDGRLATASFDNAVGLWEDTTPIWLDGHEAAVNTVLYAHDTLWSGGDDFTLRRWPTGKVIGRHEGKITALAALPGLIASASWDGSIGLWPLDGAAPTRLTGKGGGVNALAASADGATLYSAASDGTIRAWNIGDKSESRQLLQHGFGINRLALNEEAGWLAYGTVDGSTKVVDLSTDEEIADFTLERRPILALAQSPDGARLAIGDGMGFITVVDTGQWQIESDRRAASKGPVWTLAFSADGTWLYAGGLDSTFYGWPVAQAGEGSPIAVAENSFQRAPEEMENGERQFARKCSICHTLTPGSNRRAGPTLHALFGRRAGTVAGYSYSERLDGSDIVWNDKSIDALFDLGPDHYIPGSKMPMQRIADPDDRADLIDYLRRATTP